MPGSCRIVPSSSWCSGTSERIHEAEGFTSVLLVIIPQLPWVAWAWVSVLHCARRPDGIGQTLSLFIAGCQWIPKLLCAKYIKFGVFSWEVVESDTRWREYPGFDNTIQPYSILRFSAPQAERWAYMMGCPKIDKIWVPWIRVPGSLYRASAILRAFIRNIYGTIGSPTTEWRGVLMRKRLV